MKSRITQLRLRDNKQPELAEEHDFQIFELWPRPNTILLKIEISSLNFFSESSLASPMLLKSSGVSPYHLPLPFIHSKHLRLSTSILTHPFPLGRSSEMKLASQSRRYEVRDEFFLPSLARFYFTYPLPPPPPFPRPSSFIRPEHLRLSTSILTLHSLSAGPAQGSSPHRAAGTECASIEYSPCLHFMLSTHPDHLSPALGSTSGEMFAQGWTTPRHDPL